MRKSNYGIVEYLKNISFVLRSKIINSKIRMIRFPIIIRGKKNIDFGINLTTGYRCRIEVNGIHKEKKLIFGKNVNMGDAVRISCASKINIGDNVLIGSRVLIIDNSHGRYKGVNQDSPKSIPNERDIVSSAVTIGDNVWIGEHVVILPGVNIDSGCIIGANSVVTKSCEKNCVLVGNPAKVIKEFDSISKRWEKV